MKKLLLTLALCLATLTPVQSAGVLILAQAPAVGCTNNLAIDGTPQVQQTTSANLSVTLSTVNTNDVIVVFAWQNGSGPAATPVTDTAGLTWIQRAVTPNNTHSYYAIASAPLSGDVVTFHLLTSAVAGVAAFSVSGANTSAPWDSNAALPFTANAGNASITTTNSCTMPITLVKNVTAAGAGWTSLIGSGFTLMEYQKVTTPQSALAGTFTGTSTATIGDALTQ